MCHFHDFLFDFFINNIQHSLLIDFELKFMKTTRKEVGYSTQKSMRDYLPGEQPSLN